MTTYKVLLDLNRNNAFDHISADVVDFVTDLSWDNGLQDSESRLAKTNQCRITLDNSGGDFSDDDSGATYYNLVRKGILVKIQAVSGPTTITLFIGKLTSKRIVSKAFMPQVQLTFVTPVDELYSVSFQPTLVQNVRTDVALRQVWSSGKVVWPYHGSYFIIDHDEIDGPVAIYDPDDANLDFDEGYVSVEWVGDVDDGRGREVGARQYIDDLITAEAGGFFYFDARSANWVFRNKGYLALLSGSSYTFDTEDNHFIDATIYRDEQLKNQVSVIYYPRQVSEVTALLWSLESPIRVAGNKDRKITARFRYEGDDSVKVAAIRVDLPLKGIDWDAAETEDGVESRVGDLTLQFEHDSKKASITIINGSSDDLWVTRFELRGQALYTFEPDEVVYTDAQSLNDYDLHIGPAINARLIDEREDAELMAMTYVSQRSTPKTAYQQIVCQFGAEDAALMDVLALDVGDLVTVVDPNSNHNEAYAILGEMHAVNRQRIHTVTLILKRKDLENYFIIDSSEIDGPDLIL